MPEGDSRNISKEIAVLEQKLEELKRVHAKPEGGPLPPEKELLREAIAERIREGLPLPPSPIPPSPAPGAMPPQIMHDELKEVEAFVSLAFDQDIPTAVKAVAKSGNAHLIDAFHDVLVDRFYEEMVRRGKISV